MSQKLYTLLYIHKIIYILDILGGISHRINYHYCICINFDQFHSELNNFRIRFMMVYANTRTISVI